MKYAKIKSLWLDPNEQQIAFEVLTLPNANNRVDISPMFWPGNADSIKPIESVDEKHIDYISQEEALKLPMLQISSSSTIDNRAVEEKLLTLHEHRAEQPGDFIPSGYDYTKKPHISPDE